MITLNTRSEKNLVGVHPDLVRVIRASADVCPAVIAFTVIEGRRSIERQIELIKTGASRIKDPANGRHVQGMAVDLCVIIDGRPRWESAVYRQLAALVLTAARAEEVDVKWGGEAFGKFIDDPHFELSREAYPGAFVPNLQPPGLVNPA